jgi:hypothetical protein
MVKLLLCMTFGLALGLVTLGQRQQRLELSHESVELHNQIESRQAKLWSQQLQIATFTSPTALSAMAAQQNLHMTPQGPGITVASGRQ